MTQSITGDQSARNVTIQKITQADFDGIGATRQAFILERIKAGQVKIVPTSEIAAAPKGKKSNNGEKSSGKMRGPLDRLRDKSVKIVLVNGQTLTGTITEISRFEVVLDTGDSLVVVLKHAIISAEETKIPDRAAAPAAGGT